MKYFTSLTVAMLLSSATWVPPAWGQTVYKCGTTYSQGPCPGGVAVDASDSRTPVQKAQADAAAAQAARNADKMEKDRLALEKSQAAKPLGKASAAGQPESTEATHAKPKPKPATKPKTPEYFTAAVPVDKNKPKKTSQKSAEKPQADSAVKPALKP